MKQIIMVPPDQFDVRYNINPWMTNQSGTVNKPLAAQQWLNVRAALVQAGADVIVMPSPPSNGPDAVFAANAGLAINGTFIPSKFKHAERQVEEPYFYEYFKNHGFDMRGIDPENPPNELMKGPLSFEGAGDALYSSDRKILWMGYGHRTSGNFKFALDYLLEDENAIVRPLKLIDSRWYHLDTCFCPLDTGELLWYPEAFDDQSRSVIELWYDKRNIKVSESDALRFACNSVSVGRNIVMPLQSDELFFELGDRGYNVISVDMSQYLKSGGACKCLTLELVA